MSNSKEYNSEYYRRRHAADPDFVEHRKEYNVAYHKQTYVSPKVAMSPDEYAAFRAQKNAEQRARYNTKKSNEAWMEKGRERGRRSYEKNKIKIIARVATRRKRITQQTQKYPNALKAIVKAQKLTYRQLSVLVGTSYSNVCLHIQDNYIPPKWIPVYAKVLGVDESTLIGHHE